MGKIVSTEYRTEPAINNILWYFKYYIPVSQSFSTHSSDYNSNTNKTKITNWITKYFQCWGPPDWNTVEDQWESDKSTMFDGAYSQGLYDSVNNIYINYIATDINLIPAPSYQQILDFGVTKSDWREHPSIIRYNDPNNANISGLTVIAYRPNTMLLLYRR